MARNRSQKLLELRGKYGKCLHYYFYLQDPVLGFLHARLQTWFPLTIHVCLNGREWLAQQMDKQGIDYIRRDNCFTQIASLKRAQELMDQQLRVSWPAFLNRIVGLVHPAHQEIFRPSPTEYYWSAEESEWASVNRGEFAINGFRNRDLRPLLYGSTAVNQQEARRHSGAITRKLRLLRAHGLIAKVPKTHRYVLTAEGTAAITALLAARQADAAKLSRLAA